MPLIIAVTKVIRQGQTYIPADVRKKFGLKTGDKIVWVEDNGRVYIIPQKRARQLGLV